MGLHEQFKELTQYLIEVEEENADLRLQLSRCQTELEVMKVFYSDFKHLLLNSDGSFNSNINSSDNKMSIQLTNNNNQSIGRYSQLLGEYYVSYDVNVLRKLIETYGEDINHIMTDIRDTFSAKIKKLISEYGYLPQYNIIKNSLKHIVRYDKRKDKTIRTLLELITLYIRNFDKGKKDKAIEYLKQALVYYPLLFNDEFLFKIRSYWHDDIHEIVGGLKVKLYGKNNILLTPEEKQVLPKPNVSKPNKKERHNYAIVDIDILFNEVKNHTLKRQTAQRFIKNMKKANRNNDDIEVFRLSANELLKIEIDE